MALQESKLTNKDHMVDALESYRNADRIVRDCVCAELLGLETPEAYDRLEALAVKNGPQSHEAWKHNAINLAVDGILRSIKLGRS